MKIFLQKIGKVLKKIIFKFFLFVLPATNILELSPYQPFKITVTKSDLSNTKTNIFTELGSEAGVSFTLSSSNIEEIVVTAKSTNLDSLGVGPGSVFNAEDISTLPSIDRDIKDIAKLDPFVTVDNGGRLSFAGGMPRLIGFIIDGVSANDSYGLSSNSYPTNRMPLSMDVIDQVSVKVANFDAELGDIVNGFIQLAGLLPFSHNSTFVIVTLYSVAGPVAAKTLLT